MKPEYYKVTDHKDLIKSSDTKAVLNVDTRSLNKYREERERLMKLSKVVEDNAKLTREVAEIKNTLSEMLDLLRNKS